MRLRDRVDVMRQGSEVRRGPEHRLEGEQRLQDGIPGTVVVLRLRPALPIFRYFGRVQRSEGGRDPLELGPQLG